MKKKNFFRVTALLIITSFLIVTMNNCNKTNPGAVDMENPNDQTGLIEKSKAMQEHILAFKAKMEYYRDNPNLKNGGELYTADSAVLELESLLNYNFCYTDIITDKKELSTSDIIMPLDEIAKINDPDLMQVYYDKVIDTIQAQMLRLNYSNMKLLLVDLKQTGTDNNGDAIVSVTSLVGNQVSGPLYDDSWWYGQEYGICNGNNAGFDAAVVLGQRVTEDMIPDPPAGYQWYFMSIHSTNYLNPLNYRMPNDPLDNYEDYQIFYAVDDPAPNPPLTIGYMEQCVSGGEMIFYEAECEAIATGFETQYNKKFYQCDLFGQPNERYGLSTIEHFYKIFLGNRYCVGFYDPADILY